MKKTIREKTEQLLERTEELLPSFAMYFLHDEKKAALLAKECILACVEKWKRREQIENEMVFLYREIRKKCFEFLCAQGKQFESMFFCSEESLKEALCREKKDEKDPLYADLLQIASSLSFLTEREREILFLILGGSLTLEETALILDRPAKELEEIYLLALMKLGTNGSEEAGKDAADPGKMLKLTRSLAFLFAHGGKNKAILSAGEKEEILTAATSKVPFDYKKAAYKACAILVFCVIFLLLMVYSHIQGEPEFQPEVKVGVFMSREELKENLLKEKARGELNQKKAEEDLTVVQISKRNFSSMRFHRENVEKRLAKLGAKVKVYKVETRGTGKEKVYLLVSTEDALKIIRSKKIMK